MREIQPPLLGHCSCDALPQFIRAVFMAGSPAIAGALFLRPKSLRYNTKNVTGFPALFSVPQGLAISRSAQSFSSSKGLSFMVKDAFLKGCNMTMNAQELIKKITEALEDADGEFVAEIYNRVFDAELQYIGDSMFESRDASPVADFKLPGVWEEISSGLYVKWFNERTAFIEARPEGKVVNFASKLQGSFGGVMLAVRQVGEATANLTDPEAINAAITILEDDLNEALKAVV